MAGRDAIDGIALDAMVANARGVVFAATAPVELLERLLGCDRGAASAFQDSAAYHMSALRIRVAQARGQAPRP